MEEKTPTPQERIDRLIKEINRHNYQYYMLDNPTPLIPNCAVPTAPRSVWAAR